MSQISFCWMNRLVAWITPIRRDLSISFINWQDQNKGILVVTHDVEFAAHLADRVIIMEQGQDQIFR